MIKENVPHITKTELAKKLGVSRASLYYKAKREAIDEEVKHQIESVMTQHKYYGHKRIAMELKLNKKRIRRVMKKYDLKVPTKKRKQPIKEADLGKSPAVVTNYLALMCPIQPYVFYVSDFTYIRYKEKFLYLATVMDVFTREIVGWHISRYHTKELVLAALQDAIERVGRTPFYIHSDQGSEYDSQSYKKLLKELKIILSMSEKASPWQNGYQESFYGKFKQDLEDVEKYETLGEVVEAIHQAIYYYNNKRIHTALKMPPVKYRELFYAKRNK